MLMRRWSEKASDLGVSLACLFSFIAPLLGGCVAADTPGDLALASVQVVDWRSQDELPGPGASPIIGMVPTRDLALMRQSVTGGEKPQRLLLKIEFTSALNLSKFVIDNGYNLGVTASFCGRSAAAYVGMSFPYVYWQGNMLGQHEPDPIERHRGSVGQLITYYFYANVAREKIVPSNPPQEGYDLRQGPGDICFRVGGGNNSGLGYRSNTVVIPKDVIATALQKAPPG